MAELITHIVSTPGLNEYMELPEGNEDHRSALPVMSDETPEAEIVGYVISVSAFEALRHTKNTFDAIMDAFGDEDEITDALEVLDVTIGEDEEDDDEVANEREVYEDDEKNDDDD